MALNLKKAIEVATKEHKERKENRFRCVATASFMDQVGETNWPAKQSISSYLCALCVPLWLIATAEFRLNPAEDI
jgi:hypothetical protein